VLDVHLDLLTVFRRGEDRLFIERTAVWFLGYNIYPSFVSVSTAVFLHLKQYLMHVCCSLKPTIFILWIALNMHNKKHLLRINEELWL
jgi:hypothetical protein